MRAAPPFDVLSGAQSIRDVGHQPWPAMGAILFACASNGAGTQDVGLALGATLPFRIGTLRNDRSRLARPRLDLELGPIAASPKASRKVPARQAKVAKLIAAWRTKLFDRASMLTSIQRSPRMKLVPQRLLRRQAALQAPRWTSRTCTALTNARRRFG